MLQGLNRRAFFGAAAGASIAAPSAVKGALEAVPEWTPTPSWNHLDGNEMNCGINSQYETTEAYWAQRIADMRREAQEAYRSYGARALDFDLAAMRSMSMSAKLTIQAERDFNRRLEAAKKGYGNRFAEYVKNTLGF